LNYNFGFGICRVLQSNGGDIVADLTTFLASMKFITGESS